MNNKIKIYNIFIIYLCLLYYILNKKSKIMQKQYVFLIILWIILYMMYLIVEYKYKEYKITSKIELLQKKTTQVRDEINEDKDYLVYLNTLAYKNKILKLDQALKSKWEEVVLITSQNFYDKYSVKIEDIPIVEEKTNNELSQIKNKNNLEKWIYFLFKKDLELNL